MLARVAVVSACTAAALVASGAPAAWADGPSVSGYTPANVLAGSVVDIVGTGLAGTTSVTFAGVAAAVTPTSVTDTDVRVAVPAAATSGPVTLEPATSAAAPTLGIETTTISRDAASVVYPNGTNIRASLKALGTGVGIAGQKATLLVRALGASSWSPSAATATTDANGAVRFLVKPTRSTEYAVAFAASTVAAGVRTSGVTVALRPTLSVTFPAVVPILTAQRISGTVHPAVSGGSVQLQRLVSGAWRSAGTVGADRYGRFAFTPTWSAKGTYTYRVYRFADSQHLATSTSAHAIVAVDRTLRSGMTGSDVSYLQRRLQLLHYDVPRVSGTFDYDTLHAVIAFEKVQVLRRDGIVSPTVWSRLGRPTAPKLLHPLSGVAAIEVDLTKQTLYYAYNGVIQKILDVSSGGGYTYTGSDGRLTTAITPQGHFHEVYKVDHWVTSKLGTLYKPAYFNNSGYAIHGEGAVPVYPASHGCVRVTVPAMDRLYPKMTTGLSIWIYKS